MTEFPCCKWMFHCMTVVMVFRLVKFNVYGSNRDKHYVSKSKTIWSSIYTLNHTTFLQKHFSVSIFLPMKKESHYLQEYYRTEPRSLD